MCNCIAEAEKALKDTNTTLDVPIVLNSKSGELSANRVTVTTAKRDQKNVKRQAASSLLTAHSAARNITSSNEPSNVSS